MPQSGNRVLIGKRITEGPQAGTVAHYWVDASLPEEQQNAIVEGAYRAELSTQRSTGQQIRGTDERGVPLNAQPGASTIEAGAEALAQGLMGVPPVGQNVDSMNAVKDPLAGTFFASNPQERPSLFDALRRQFAPGQAKINPEPAIGVATGAVKGAAQTGLNVFNIMRQSLGMEPVEQPQILQPSNRAESFGRGAEQMAEFFAPAGVIKRIPILARAVSSGILPRAIAEGAGSAMVTAAQTGGDVTSAGLNGAVDAAFTASFGGVGNLLERGSRRAVTAALRPSDKLMNSGFDAENIFKHGLDGGSLVTVAKRTRSKLTELSQELNEAIAVHGNTQVDVLSLLEESILEVRAKGKDAFGKLSNLQVSADFWLDEIAELSQDGVVDLVTLQTIKQVVGSAGSWGDQVNPRQMKAFEEITNTFYRKLNQNIVGVAPEVQEINRKLSEVIPINNALIARLPREMKQNMFQFAELIVASGGASAAAGTLSGGGGSTGLLSVLTGTSGLLLLVRATHSTRGASQFNTVGGILQRTASGSGKIVAGSGAVPTIVDSFREGPQ